jgi:4-hydroxybenzoate polyprenyltransferase
VDSAAAPRKRFDVVAYLKLFRFPLVFTAIADSAAGYLLGAYEDPVQVRTMVLLALASSGLYLFGMAFNDIADFKKDQQLAPNKVLPSGRVSPGGARIAAWTVLMVSLCAILAVREGPTLQRVILWAAILGAILGYDSHLLKYPPTMGLVRALNVLLGLGCRQVIVLQGAPRVGELKVWECAILILPTLIYVSGLTYVSTLEDVEFSRGTLTVGVGMMSAGALLAVVAFPLLLFMFVSDLTGRVSFPPVGIVRWPESMAPLGLIAWLLSRALRAKDRKGVMLLVRDGVAGIILLDSMILLGAGLPRQGLWIAALLLPAAAAVAIFKRLA